MDSLFSGLAWEAPGPVAVFLLLFALWIAVSGAKKILGAALVAALVAALWWYFVMPLLG